MQGSQLPYVEPFDKKQNTEGKKQKKGNNSKQLKTFTALNYQKTDTIKLENYQGKRVSVETDKQFVESVQLICKQKQSIIKDLIQKKGSVLSDLQCEQIHFKARLHDGANKINYNSHRTKNEALSEKSLISLYCKCGCDRFKGEKYPISYDLQDIHVLGSGVILFFLFMRNIIVGVLSFVLIYAIYALVLNLNGNYVNQQNNISACTSSYCFYRDQASVANRMSGEYYTTILTYVGLLGMIVWSFIARFILENGRNKNHQIDKNLTSASDYAIKINNLPYGQYNQEELLEYLDKISKKAEANRLKRQKNEQFERNEDDDIQFEDREQSDNTLNDDQKQQDTRSNMAKNIIGDRLDIKSIQIIYNMEFSRKMLAKIQELCSSVFQNLQKQDNIYFITDKEQYQKSKRQLLEIYELFQDLRKKFLNDGSFRKKISTRTAIIEFNSKRGKNVILSEFSSNKITILTAIKQKLTAKFFGQDKAELIFKGQIPIFIRAPEPSDIIWNNCQKKESAARIFFIYIIAFIIILISFGLIVTVQYFVINSLGLKKVNQNTNQNPEQNSMLSTILNIVTSIILQIINKFLWFSMFYLLDLEYNHSNTSKIVSQMRKTLFAMSINVIALPIIVNYGFGNGLYGGTGLAGIVFDYHISAVTINIVLQLINPVFIVIKVCLYVKKIRNFIIRAMYNKSSENQNQSNNLVSMKKIYSLYEGLQFNIAQSYIFIVNNMFHAFFFCELQPFIVVLFLIQAFLFFWVCKIKILKMCKIPHLTQVLIFEVASYFLMVIPIFYGTGGIFVSYVENKINPEKKFQFIAFSICIFLGVINYLNPKNISQKMIKKLIKCCNCLKPNQNKALINKSHQKMNIKQIETEKKEVELRENKQDQREKGQNEKRESEKKIFKETLNKQRRQENYYKESNSISLLGFQHKIKGLTNFSDIEWQLRNYCSSHIPNSSKRLQKIKADVHQQDKYSEDYLKPLQIKIIDQKFL